MKTIFRVLMLGLVTAVTGTIAFAQTTTATPTPTAEACTFEQQSALYTKFQTGRKSQNLADIKAGVQAGEEFLAKCRTEEQKVVVAHIEKFLPGEKLRAEKTELYLRFNAAINDPKNLKADEAFSSGRAIIEKDPDSALNVMIALALVGFDGSLKTPPVDKYNSEAITLAKKVISELDAGKTSNSYGALKLSRVVLDAQKKPDHPKSKSNTIGWMNYVIGSIMYFNQKMEKDALPYFYKTTQIDSDVKNNPLVYQAIGAWFLKEIKKIDDARNEKIKLNGDKDNEETLAMYALEKGYAERGINAYAKAHKIASADAKTPQQLDYKKTLYEKLQALYLVRFENKTEGLDAYIATASTQPLIDPATPVAPVIEVVPATTTTSSTTTPPTTPVTTTTTTTTTTKPVTTTPVTTKPAVTTPTTTTKPTSTTTKPASSTGGKTNTTKPKATVNKKKGVK